MISPLPNFRLKDLANAQALIKEYVTVKGRENQKHGKEDQEIPRRKGPKRQHQTFSLEIPPNSGSRRACSSYVILAQQRLCAGPLLDLLLTSGSMSFSCAMRWDGSLAYSACYSWTRCRQALSGREGIERKHWRLARVSVRM